MLALGLDRVQDNSVYHKHICGCYSNGTEKEAGSGQHGTYVRAEEPTRDVGKERKNSKAKGQRKNCCQKCLPGSVTRRTQSVLSLSGNELKGDTVWRSKNGK